MDRLKGKVAIITGAGTGVGRACMKSSRPKAPRCIGVSRTQANLDETLAQVKAAKGDGKVVAADLAKPESADKIVGETLNAYGRVDVLVNWPASATAGWKRARDRWARSSTPLRRNGGGDGDQPRLAVLYVPRVIPHMQKQKSGSIVNVTSISGLLGLPVAHTYTAAKGAAINLTRSLAITYCNDSIRANCIAPGFIKTPMVESLLHLFDDPNMADRLVPMKRPGTAEEMAYGCLYFASDESTYCQGSVLVIDGGTLARQ